MIVIYEDVLWFEISVSITSFVNVCHSCSNLQHKAISRLEKIYCRESDIMSHGTKIATTQHLSEEFSALCLAQSVSVHNVVEQLSPRAILQHHVDFCVGFENLENG